MDVSVSHSEIHVYVLLLLFKKKLAIMFCNVDISKHSAPYYNSPVSHITLNHLYLGTSSWFFLSSSTIM